MFGVIDMECGVKVFGVCFYFLCGIGVCFEIVFMNLVFDKVFQNGFVLLIMFMFVWLEIMQGIGFLGEYVDEVYYFDKDDDLYFVGISEVVFVGYYKDEIVDFVDGVFCYVGWLICYCCEVGLYGKDICGIIWVYQFNKFEMFVYMIVEDVEVEYLCFVVLQEEMLIFLGFVYCVIDVVVGDFGLSVVCKYDIEVWVLMQGVFCEFILILNCMIFQVCCLDVWYCLMVDVVDVVQGIVKMQYVVMLNGMFVMMCWIVVLFEMYQQVDGLVCVFEIFCFYFGGLDVICLLIEGWVGW